MFQIIFFTEKYDYLYFLKEFYPGVKHLEEARQRYPKYNNIEHIDIFKEYIAKKYVLHLNYDQVKNIPEFQEVGILSVKVNGEYNCFLKYVKLECILLQEPNKYKVIIQPSVNKELLFNDWLDQNKPCILKENTEFIIK